MHRQFIALVTNIDTTLYKPLSNPYVLHGTTHALGAMNTSWRGQLTRLYYLQDELIFLHTLQTGLHACAQPSQSERWTILYSWRSNCTVPNIVEETEWTRTKETQLSIQRYLDDMWGRVKYQLIIIRWFVNIICKICRYIIYRCLLFL